MSKLINKLPLPITGLMLALAAIGNLFLSYGNVYRNIFGIISTLIFILIVIKIFTNYKGVVNALENPVIASVTPTFSMAMMILSTYIKPMSNNIALGTWILGLIIHSLLIVYFTKKFILNFNIKKVFPSYFVVYVGIVVGSVTAPVFKLLTLGQGLFWFGFVSYLILLPIVIYRVFFVKEIKEPVLPTITIFAAPASLCLAGYLSSFPEKNMFIVSLLTTLSIVMLIGVIGYMPKMLRIKFYPSYSAFTFPFVISAIAIKKANAFLTANDTALPAMKYLVNFEEFFALIIVLYVLIRYSKFLLINPEKIVTSATK